MCTIVFCNLLALMNYNLHTFCSILLQLNISESICRLYNEIFSEGNMLDPKVEKELDKLEQDFFGYWNIYVKSREFNIRDDKVRYDKRVNLDHEV